MFKVECFIYYSYTLWLPFMSTVLLTYAVIHQKKKKKKKPPDTEKEMQTSKAICKLHLLKSPCNEDDWKHRTV